MTAEVLVLRMLELIVSAGDGINMEVYRLNREVNLDLGAVRLTHVMLVVLVLEKQDRREWTIVGIVGATLWDDMCEQNVVVIEVLAVGDDLVVVAEDLHSDFDS